MRIFLLCILVLACVWGAPALAHKVIVFAYVEGSDVVVEGSFPGGKPCKNCPVTVRDIAEGTDLLQGKTDAKGLWRFPLPPFALSAKQGLEIILEAGEGHRATWTLEPAEYMQHTPATPESGASPMAQEPAAPAATAPSSDAGAQPAPQPIDMALLRQVVAQASAEAVSREIAPLKRSILQADEPGLRDILGGIGYLVGFAGLFAYARSRKS